MKFICDMSTIQTYLEKWGGKRISATSLPKFWENVGERREEREMMREKGISAMILPKKKKLNCDKSNALATNYFTIFFTNCCYGQFLTDSC